MSREQDALRHFGEQTEPRSEAAARVRDRLLDEGWVAEPEPSRGLLAAFRTLSSPVEHAADRVAARVRFSLALMTGRRAAVSFGLVAAAAALLLGLPALLAPSPTVSQTLVAATPTSWALPDASVKLDYQGDGELAGTAAAPRIDWRRGTVRVEVEPERGIDLRVQTPEAEVTVLGTVFAVTRDAVGSLTTVERGHVRVTCADGGEHSLRAGDRQLCAPTTPAGLLARGRALQKNGDLDGALRAWARAAADAGPVGIEARFARAGALVEAGRLEAGLQQLGALIEGGAGHREAQARGLAARVALTTDGCGEALRWIEALPDAEPDLRRRCR